MVLDLAQHAVHLIDCCFIWDYNNFILASIFASIADIDLDLL